MEIIIAPIVKVNLPCHIYILNQEALDDITGEHHNSKEYLNVL